MNNTYNPIAMVLDSNYVIAAEASIKSLLINKHKNVNYKLYILSNNLTADEKVLLENIVKEYPLSSISFIDLNLEKYNGIFHSYDGNTGANSITALAKFEIPQLLSEEKKVLYLDCDLLVLKDISELFSLSLEQYIAGVVKDSGRIYNHDGLRAKISNYFNSGVMLLNLEKMRNEGTTQKLVNAKIALNNHKLVDQDAFNIVFQNQTLLLPVKYNALMINLFNSSHKFNIHQFNKFFNSKYSCLYDLEDDVSIIHFASKEKPWLSMEARYSDLWHTYGSSNISTDSSKKGIIVPVLLATDRNYLFQTGVTIQSVVENASPNNTYKFYIFMPESPLDEDKVLFNRIIEANRPKKVSINYIIIDTDKYFKKAVMRIEHISKPTFYRLIAAGILKDYDKLVYLDSDVIVESDISDYFSINIDNYYVAGVKATSYVSAKNGNIKYCQENGLPAIDQYINAGVILMNLKQIRENDLEKEFLARVPKGYRSQDQDIINGVCYNHILHIPYKYNCQISKYEQDYVSLLKVFSEEIVNEAHNAPCIIHYASSIKPWNNLDCILAERWFRYAKKLPEFSVFYEKCLDSYLCASRSNRFNLFNAYLNPSLNICNENIRDLVKNSITSRFEIRPDCKIGSRLFDDLIFIKDIRDFNADVKRTQNNEVMYIESAMGRNSVTFESLYDGQLTFKCLTRNCKEEIRDFFSIVLDLKINGKSVVTKRTCTYKTPCVHKLTVKKNQILKIDYSWAINFNNTLIKASQNSVTSSLAIQNSDEINKILKNQENFSNSLSNLLTMVNNSDELNKILKNQENFSNSLSNLCTMVNNSDELNKILKNQENFSNSLSNFSTMFENTVNCISSDSRKDEFQNFDNKQEDQSANSLDVFKTRISDIENAVSAINQFVVNLQQQLNKMTNEKINYLDDTVKTLDDCIIKIPGASKVYCCNKNSIAQNIDNIPYKSSFRMEVYCIRYLSNKDCCFKQVLMQKGTTFTRYYSKGLWSEWSLAEE